MKIITKGHVYELKYASKKASELIHFIHKVSDPKDPKKKLDVVMDGTTNEEVLAVLIDRMKYLDGILPSKDNREVIRHLESALAMGERTNKVIKGNCDECQFEPENGHAHNCSKRKEQRRNFHICVPIKKALDMLKDGKNIFTGTPLEAFHDLMTALDEGKEFYSGCDNMGADGRCKGHEVV